MDRLCCKGWGSSTLGGTALGQQIHWGSKSLLCTAPQFAASLLLRGWDSRSLQDMVFLTLYLRYK